MKSDPILRPKVQVLPDSVAEKIAAGEVIERPASVVKELVENALDAGATQIQVLLEQGGKSLIEITDNGHGMSEEDLKLATLRHATSKIKTLQDLNSLRTLGFRGEALPSIGAVADVTITTRTVDSDSAYLSKRVLSPSFSPPEKTTIGHFLSFDHGTQIRVQALFNQIPARLKFLKSDATESSIIKEYLERISLSHPECGFSLIHNDKTLLSLSSETEKSRVHKILSTQEDLTIHYEELDVFLSTPGKIRAYWLQGSSVPHTKKIIQILNGRAIKDRLIQQAVIGAFKQALLPGKFPAVTLFLDIDPSQVDVNVHPSKMEVRFLNQSKIFHEVDKVFKTLLQKTGAGRLIGEVTHPNPFPNAQPTYPSYQKPTQERFASFTKQTGYSANSHSPQSSFSLQASLESQTDSIPSIAITPAITPKTETQPHPLQFAKYAGSLFQTYLLFDEGHELTLVDQHAAHERIRYEKIKKAAFDNGDSAPCQQLLIPEPISFEQEHKPLLSERLILLEQMGFDVEFFSETSLLFRGVPTAWGMRSLKHRLGSLVETLIHLESVNKENLLDESVFEKLASEACHSAIRAGDTVLDIEATTLVSDLFKCENPWNCPHGRPTIVKIARSKFEEWFQRKV